MSGRIEAVSSGVLAGIFPKSDVMTRLGALSPILNEVSQLSGGDTLPSVEIMLRDKADVLMLGNVEAYPHVYTFLLKTIATGGIVSLHAPRLTSEDVELIALLQQNTATFNTKIPTKYLVLHPNWIGQDRKSVSEVVSQLVDSGVSIALENSDICDAWGDPRNLLSLVGEQIHILIDFAHLAAVQPELRVSAATVINTVTSHIIAVHLSTLNTDLWHRRVGSTSTDHPIHSLLKLVPNHGTICTLEGAVRKGSAAQDIIREFKYLRHSASIPV